MTANPIASGQGALSHQASTVLRLITLAANTGEPCPSNNTLVGALGCSSVSGPPKLLDRLVKLGFIKIERGSQARVVTILATGKRTAGVIKAPHFSAGKGKPKQRAPYRPRSLDWVPPKNDARDLVHVHREPCPRCGTRADHGCAHSGSRLAMEMSL